LVLPHWINAICLKSSNTGVRPWDRNPKGAVWALQLLDPLLNVMGVKFGLRVNLLKGAPFTWRFQRNTVKISEGGFLRKENSKN
jgi:hypothetical protein